MMKQYQEIKNRYPDCILFYRMGDFYELFLEDAHVGARILNITLTAKANGKQGRIPMAGVPYHAVDAYLTKLVKAGYKVAICEQLSPPNKKGLVERDVVRIVTPGTLMSEQALEGKEHNNIVCLDIVRDLLAISYADISTGNFVTYEVQFSDLSQVLADEFSRISPRECILPERLYEDHDLLKLLKREQGINVFPYSDWNRFCDNAEAFLKKHFGVATLTVFGLENDAFATKTAAVLLGYLQYTQKNTVSHIKKISRPDNTQHMVLDRASIINLELFSTIREHDAKGSLLHVLDKTGTPMGGRMLKSWLKEPLIDKQQIEERHEAVGELVQNEILHTNIVELLLKIPDIERLHSRLAVQMGNARDLVNLKSSLETILQINVNLEKVESDALIEAKNGLSESLITVIETVAKMIVDEPPIDTKAGGLIRDGVNKKIDELRKIIRGSREWMLDLEQKEREKTGISTLKIKFNKVFGFYIEISKANLSLVPDYFERKQTLVNGERFSTPELKHHEEIILSAEEKLNALEYELFIQTLLKVLEHTNAIQLAAYSIATIDCLANFAKLAKQYDYVRPKMLYSGEIRIVEGRHPVVEQLLDTQKFVPNDTPLDNVSQQMLLITGPNMAGKSVYLRQVALIVLMAQIGCFVPAKSAHISVVDRIFVRSGASDMITSGLSTFMVEMVETARILHNATKNSLIIMDEIGRGTSTYDGISIAWAVAEYLVTHFKVAPKTLFATHYHELQALAEQYPQNIANFHMAVVQEAGNPVFLHTLLPGGASHSFGVAVARLAGVPDEVVEKAQEMLQDLEKRSQFTSSHSEMLDARQEVGSAIVSTNLIDHVIHRELEKIDISRMTPLEALNKLAELKEKLSYISTHTDTFEVD